MTTFPLAKGIDGGVREEDRPGLVPLLVSVVLDMRHTGMWKIY